MEGPFSRISVPRTTTSRPVHWAAMEVKGRGSGGRVRHRPRAGSNTPVGLTGLSTTHSPPVQTDAAKEPASIGPAGSTRQVSAAGS